MAAEPGSTPRAVTGPDVDQLTHEGVRAWAGRGVWIEVEGRRIFTVDIPATSASAGDPLLVLHGFPSSSFDWRHVVGPMAAGRRVVLLDFLACGLSDKPDQRYRLEGHADTAAAVARHAGLDRVVLVSHDIGDSVAGELLARQMDGTLGFEVTGRVLTNGSIYLDLVQLTSGQQLLLGLDDARLDFAALGVDPEESYCRGMATTFSPDHQPSADELDGQWQLAAFHDGYTLLPRLIRYIEDRRANEGRYTGAIETHPSPLHVVWGDADPVARYPMAQRLVEKRPGTPLVTLDGVGHYPMVEDPERFAAAVAGALADLP